MSWVAVAIGGSALLGAGASLAAAGEQSDAAAQAAGLTREQYQQTRKDLMPWMEGGKLGFADLLSLMGIGREVTTPGTTQRVWEGGGAPPTPGGRAAGGGGGGGFFGDPAARRGSVWRSRCHFAPAGHRAWHDSSRSMGQPHHASAVWCDLRSQRAAGEAVYHGRLPGLTQLPVQPPGRREGTQQGCSRARHVLRPGHHAGPREVQPGCCLS